jgi:hypothetical protein
MEKAVLAEVCNTISQRIDSSGIEVFPKSIDVIAASFRGLVAKNAEYHLKRVEKDGSYGNKKMVHSHNL